MGWTRGHFMRLGLVGLAASWLLAASAGAVVTTERTASILIFPKILSNGTYDTIVQMTNRSNNVVYAHCFYVDASLTDPSQPESPLNTRQWQEVDFDIVLTKQQPTHWVVSLGRATNPFDSSCTRQGVCIGGTAPADTACGTGLPACPGAGGRCSNTDCSDAGFDPGRIPPVSPGFEGELKCIEVDQSGAPLNGNNLKGEATLLSVAEVPGKSKIGDASKYNAIGVVGLNDNDGDTVLCLGGGASSSCPFGAEYDGCPNEVRFNHFAEGATDPVVEAFGNGDPNNAPSSVYTELTIVPCTEDFEQQRPTTVRININSYNEFESVFSSSTQVDCWGNFTLESIRPVFDVGPIGTRFVQTILRPAPGDSGFVGVMEEFHTQEGAGTARDAMNLHVIGERTVSDLISIPEGP